MWQYILNVLRSWLYFKLTYFLLFRLVFYHHFYQLLRLRMTFNFYPPSLPFIYAMIHQVNKSFFLWNILISPFHCHSGKFFVVVRIVGCFSSIPVYSLEANIILYPLKYKFLSCCFSALLPNHLLSSNSTPLPSFPGLSDLTCLPDLCATYYAQVVSSQSHEHTKLITLCLCSLPRNAHLPFPPPGRGKETVSLHHD